MSLKQALEKHGATPGKLALIGVLSLVLVVVVAKQLSSSADGRALQPNSSTREQAKATRPPGKTEAAKQQKEVPPWPKPNLAKTLANDPFVLPRWAKVAETKSVAATEAEDDLSEIQQQGASVVVIGKGIKSASIGEQRYYVGDIVRGYRVTDITAKGILLHKLQSP